MDLFLEMQISVRDGGVLMGLGALCFLVACSRAPPAPLLGDASPPIAASPEAIELARARDLARKDGATLDPNQARAVAKNIEARAAREGGGARAAELHSLASRIFERLWRSSGQQSDGPEALWCSNAASRELGRGDCDEEFRRARLAGDLAHDASITYVELLRARDRLGIVKSSPRADGGVCEQAVLDSLARLEPFRPDPQIVASVSTEASNEAAELARESDVRQTTTRPPQVVALDAFPGEDASRIVVTLDRAAEYRAGDEMLAGAPGPSTFVELDGVSLGAAVRERRLAGIVTAIRADATTTGTRVSLALSGHAYRRVFYMEEPYRIVIDVARQAPGLGRSPREVARVALDPGHGGRDAGAVGPTGLQEKDVTLDVAKRIARALALEGLKAKLTRDSDQTLTLEERTATANAFAADLFVSIHCNASEGHTKRGLETYVLDTTSDAVAARVAARENATTTAASLDLSAMLSRMRLADQAERSTRFAHLLERAAVSSLRTSYPDAVSGGVHVAGFYVLVGARMPGVLLETSYVSNPQDERRLASEDYRQALADGVVNAVRAYREGR